ncbi:MAG TPA: hypothetical protein DCE44_00530 [Verrucomicrobiales bacterium]|nr:hypothetical protein [Verrucomicrobiales bacterium]
MSDRFKDYSLRDQSAKHTTVSESADMKTSSSYGGHSALVRMRLLLNGRIFRIAQMGPDFLFVESPGDHPPARATIEMQVDDSRRTWEVNLPQGMKVEDHRVALGSIG